MNDHSAFQEAREPTAYRGTTANGRGRTTVALDTRGNIQHTQRTRKHPADELWLTPIIIFGLLGAGICISMAFKLPLANFIPLPPLLVSLLGLLMAGGSLLATNHLLFKTTRFTISTNIDPQTLRTLRKFNKRDPEVTGDLAAIAKATQSLNAAKEALVTVEERIKLGGTSADFESQKERLESRVVSHQEELTLYMGRLIDFASALEQTTSK